MTLTSVDRPKSGAIVIVVVEDEPDLRLNLLEAMGLLGFRAIGAESAEETMELLEAGANDIDAVFTDIHLQKPMNGLMLANHIRMRWPWIGTLITSGHATPPADAIPEGCVFISKPYKLGDVVGHIQRIARQPPAAEAVLLCQPAVTNAGLS